MITLSAPVDPITKATAPTAADLRAEYSALAEKGLNAFAVAVPYDAREFLDALNGISGTLDKVFTRKRSVIYCRDGYVVLLVRALLRRPTVSDGQRWHDCLTCDGIFLESEMSPRTGLCLSCSPEEEQNADDEC